MGFTGSNGVVECFGLLLDVSVVEMLLLGVDVAW